VSELEGGGKAAATAIAVGRIGLGVGFTLVPKLALRAWPGRGAGDDATIRFLARSTGGRDLAIGVGTLLAIQKDAPVRGWLEAGMLADAVDAVAILLAFRSMPKLKALFALASAVGSVLASRRAIASLS
jgi:hypothetical protein